MFTTDYNPPGEETAFTVRPKIHSRSQILSHGQSIFCLPLWPKFSDSFELCLHSVSLVRDVHIRGGHIDSSGPPGPAFYKAV